MAQLMKGETWQDANKLVRGKLRFEYPVIAEVKADEIRCRVHSTWDAQGNRVVNFDSYAGKPLHNMEVFADQFNRLLGRTGLDELDVGVLVNDNFNDSYRWVRSANGYPVEKFDKKTGKTAPSLLPQDVKFILFDMPESDAQFRHRLEVLDKINQEAWAFVGLRMHRPARWYCMTAEAVHDAYTKARAEGHEGIMVKTLEHVYQRRRTYDWMKYKPSEDHDGQIAGFNEAVSLEGVPLGRVGSINVTCADGSTASPSGIPHALGKELWENQAAYVGQWVEFYCMERDRQGGYRHPIYHRFREDK